MKRILACLVLLLALTAWAGAQPSAQKAAEQTTAEEEPNLGWMWANFVILVIGLGYLGSKFVPPILRARTEDIQSSMQESARLKAASDARLAEIERRLSGIDNEIGKLRVELTSETEAEHVRMRQETERMLNRVRDQAQQEIQYMTKASRLELKAYSAELAIDLAAQRIRARMNRDTQQSMVDAFIADLRKEGGGLVSRQ